MSRIYRNLGTVAMEPKGEYNSSTYYEKLNMVNYEGSTYVAKEPVQGETPSSSSKWMFLGVGLPHIDSNLVEYIFPKFMANNSSGDCNLIKYKGINILIDCEKPAVWTSIKQMLDDNDVEHIDYFICTHYHIDHIGNFENLITYGYITTSTQLYMSAETTTFGFSETIQAYKTICSNNNLTWYVPSENETLTIDKLKLTFTNCDAETLDTYYTDKDQNNTSTIVLVEHDNVKSLYTGDAHSIVLKRVDDLQFVNSTIDLYKIGHHGIDNFTYVPLLLKLHPKYAVQTGGINHFSMNEFGLGADVDLLNNMGTIVYPCFMQTEYIKFISNGIEMQNISGVSGAYAMTNQTRSIYVDASATNAAIQDGSQAHPFHEIMQAVGLAQSFKGILTTIRIAEGEYGYSLNTQAHTTEKNRITITKHSNIILTGVESDNSKVVINGLYALDANVRCEHLTIDNSNHDGVYARNSNIELNNCVITNPDAELSTHNGIYARNSRISIVSTTIDYSTPMIYANNGSVVTYSSLTFGDHNSGGITNNKAVIYENIPIFNSSTTKLANLKQYTQKLKPVQIYYNNTEEYSATEQNYSNNITIDLGTFRYFVIEYTAQNSYKYFSSGQITSPGQNLIGIDAIYTQESTSARTDRITTVGIRLQNTKFQYDTPKTTNIRLDKTDDSITTTMTDVRHIHVRRITAYYEDEVIALN